MKPRTVKEAIEFFEDQMKLLQEKHVAQDQINLNQLKYNRRLSDKIVSLEKHNIRVYSEMKRIETANGVAYSELRGDIQELTGVIKNKKPELRAVLQLIGQYASLLIAVLAFVYAVFLK